MRAFVVSPILHRCKRFAISPHRQPCFSLRTQRRLNHEASQCITNNLIEVETRFAVTPQVRETLLTKLGTPKEVTIHDRYLSEELALMDRWLRVRNGAWELKQPVHGRRSQPTAGGAVVYKELEGDSALLEVENLGFDVRNLEEYANIVTVRNMWDFDVQLSHGLYNVFITLDDTTASDGFSCSIGEVETLVETKDDVDNASNAVEQVCSKYGLEIVTTVGGSKIIKYLYEKNRQLHDKLEKVGLN